MNARRLVITAIPLALCLFVAIRHVQPEETRPAAIRKRPLPALAPAGVSPAAVHGTGTVGAIPIWTDTGPSGNAILGDSIIRQSLGRIGIGPGTPGSPLTVQGMVESALDGYKFPDGTVQTTAAVTGLLSVAHDSTLTGEGTAAAPLGVAVPLEITGPATPTGGVAAWIRNHASGGIGVRIDAGFGTYGTGLLARGGTSIDGAGGGVGVEGRGGSNSDYVAGSGMVAVGGGSDSGTGGNGLFAQGGGSATGSAGPGIRARGGISGGQRAGDGIESTGADSDQRLGGSGVVARGGGSTAAGYDSFGGIGVESLGGENRFGAGGHGLWATGGRSESGIGGYGVRAIGGGSDFGSGGHGLLATGGSGVTNERHGRAALFGGATEVLGTTYMGGDLNVTGTKNFRIDHPLDPENRYLLHAAIESSEVLNVYSGNAVTDARGVAVVQLPAWFEALNRDLRYQVTVIGTFAQAIVAGRVSENRFVIMTSAPDVEVSWQVTGVRSDAGMAVRPFRVEEDKPEGERGTYLEPAAFGQPEERGVGWARYPELMRLLRQQNAAGGRDAQ